MKFGGLRASLILLDRREPEPRQSACALMADIGVLVLGHTKDLTASRAGYVKDSAAIALADIMDERASCRSAVESQKAKQDLRIAVPENASVPAAWARAARPSSRIEVLKTVKREQADAYRSLSPLLRRRRVSVRTNEIAMGCTYVFHHSPEGLYFPYINLTLPPLRIDDDPSRVVCVVPRFDKNIDLSLDAGNNSTDRSVRGHAKFRGKLVRNQASDQSFIKFPVLPNATHRSRTPKRHITGLPRSSYTIRPIEEQDG
jgi:hypothetical protein